MNTITDQKIEKYLQTTKTALEKISIAEEKSIPWKKKANEFLDMATRYYKDALYYRKRGDVVTAFAAVTYAHGWIDAGVRLGLFDAEEGSSDYIMPTE